MNGTTSHENRPPRIEKALRRLVIRGVKSMVTLNPTDKLVYLEILHLDQKRDGCYAGAEIIADRCGQTIRKVEDTRRVLKARGLLASNPRPGYLNHAWFATLPIPLPDAISNPTVERVHELRDQLDQAANLPTESRTPVVGNSGTESRTSNPHSDTRSRTPFISTEPSTELSTEPRTEPTESIQEEEVLETFKKKWHSENGREPTAEDIVRFAPAGWDR